MSFYRQLSKYYDEIFSFDEAEAAFMRDRLQGMRSLLDIGCATGNKTILFAGQVERIVGIDADQLMIETARQKHAADNISYLVMDMRDLQRRFAPGCFDALICLGNTLVHLDCPQAIAELVRQMACLAARRCIIQIVNYDRVIDRQISSLPLLVTPRVSFSRQYVWQDGQLHFVTSLQIKDKRYNNDIVLTPLRKDQLAEMLNLAGFTRQQYYGDFYGQPWQHDSFATIVVADKTEGTA